MRSSGAPGPPILVGTQPGSTALLRTLGQWRAIAAARAVTNSLLSEYACDAVPRSSGPVEVVEGGATGGVHVAAEVDQSGGAPDERREEVRRQQVDGEHTWMAVCRRVPFRLGVDAGVVNDCVEASERVDVLGEGAGFVVVGEVAGRHTDSSLCEGSEVCGTLRVAGVEDHGVAAVEQRLCSGATESCGGPGYEDSGHRASLGVDCAGSSSPAGPVDSASCEAAQEPSRRRRSSDGEPGSAA